MKPPKMRTQPKIATAMKHAGPTTAPQMKAPPQPMAQPGGDGKDPHQGKALDTRGGVSGHEHYAYGGVK